jgi:TRAP-type uncharacterized transport system fused permease subunit
MSTVSSIVLSLSQIYNNKWLRFDDEFPIPFTVSSYIFVFLFLFFVRLLLEMSSNTHVSPVHLFLSTLLPMTNTPK